MDKTMDKLLSWGFLGPVSPSLRQGAVFEGDLVPLLIICQHTAWICEGWTILKIQTRFSCIVRGGLGLEFLGLEPLIKSCQLHDCLYPRRILVVEVDVQGLLKLFEEAIHRTCCICSTHYRSQITNQSNWNQWKWKINLLLRQICDLNVCFYTLTYKTKLCIN